MHSPNCANDSSWYRYSARQINKLWFHQLTVRFLIFSLRLCKPNTDKLVCYTFIVFERGRRQVFRDQDCDDFVENNIYYTCRVRTSSVGRTILPLRNRSLFSTDAFTFIKCLYVRRSCFRPLCIQIELYFSQNT